MRIIWIWLVIACLASCSRQPHPVQATLDNELDRLVAISDAPVYAYQIQHTYPHDKQLFTEGLVYENGSIYESSGLNFHSKLIQYSLGSSQVLKQYSLAGNYFAEGIALLGKQIYQLTYHSQIGFIYDKNTFGLNKTFAYAGEGWGLTTNQTELIMSNGSEKIVFYDPKTFTSKRFISVHDNQHQFVGLNELEYCRGYIYANIWPTNYIAIIYPDTGKIKGWINVSKLNPCQQCTNTDYAANGIAYDTSKNELLVTGKYWPHIYGLTLRSVD